MSNKLVVQAQPQVMDIISRASAQGATVEQMQQLFELKLRVDADEARKAYFSAFSAFKAEAVTIVKGTDVKAGPLAGSKYANLFDVVNAVIPALSKHGLSHSWKLTKDEKDWMEVTCFISHSLGHSESVSMGAAPDTGPGRNAIQARGSSKSYLERYTLLAAVGMAAADTDTDANDAAAPQLPLDEFDSLLSRIEGAKTIEELQRTFAAGYQAASKAKDQAAQRQFMSAKDKRKKELL